MIPTGETKRLILRPLALADAPQIQELFPHWEIVCHLLRVVPWPYPDDGALRFIRDKALPAMERGDQWTWALRLKSAPRRRRQSRLLARSRVAGPGLDERSLRLGQRLLVRATRLPCASRRQGRRQHRIAPHLREARHASRRRRRKRIRLRAPAFRNLGDHGRRMAEMEGALCLDRLRCLEIRTNSPNKWHKVEPYFLAIFSVAGQLTGKEFLLIEQAGRKHRCHRNQRQESPKRIEC